MSSQNPKRMLYTHFAALARVLGNEHRLELLELLGQGEQSVARLTARSGGSFANVSQHLQHLRKGGLVTGRRDGKNIVYRLREGPIAEAIAALRHLAERNVDAVQGIVDAYFSSLDNLEPIGSDELTTRLKAASVTLLDVRPEDEFRSGHLPGALNIDMGSLAVRLSELPRDLEIVAYCRGPYCVLSFHAVHVLRGRGFMARRLRDGLPEWKAAGRPVETA